jgi:hypothetical protein
MTGNNARTAYEAAIMEMEKFCGQQTDVTPIIQESEYPFRVDYVANGQISLFEGEMGEVGELRVSCGIETTVISTMRFAMDETLLKKLIRMARNAGTLYYQAFREDACTEERYAKKDEGERIPTSLRSSE